MAKLRGKAKEEFLKRMAKGRKKATAKNPKKRKPAKRKKPAAKKKPAAPRKKKAAVKTNPRPATKTTRAAKKAGNGKRPATRKKAGNGKRTRRRNPEGMSGAESMFQEFHGKAPGRILEYDQQFRYPDKFAEMGWLLKLKFDLDTQNPNFPLTEFGKCQAVCTPDGSNIYFIGGDQSLRLDDLNIATDKDVVELGPCTFIEYHTVKGFHDFEPIDYRHRFGEEDGCVPTLAYDRLNRTLFLLGGNYRVRPEGIVN